MLSALAALVLLVGAGPSSAPTTSSALGQKYESEDLDALAPGKKWILHTSIPGAPNLRGAYVYARESGGGKAKVDPSSLISFGIDPVPFTKDPAAYVKSGFDRMAEPPLSFKPGKRAAVKMKGNAPAFRIEAHRQSQAVAASSRAREDQAFVDAVSSFNDDADRDA